MSIDSYEKYKNDIPWLGPIPENWETKRVKDIFSLVTEKAHVGNDFVLLSIYTHIGVRPRSSMEQRGNKAVTTDGYWHVKKGDFIVNKLLAWMGAIAISNFDGVTSPAYDILRKKVALNERYYEYLFRSQLAHAEFKRNSRGIMDVRLRLYFDRFGSIHVPFPELGIQNEIVKYLDVKTSTIDLKIKTLEQKKKLYDEYAKSLIKQVVTKGISQTVTFKESGIDWVGEIPTHWNLKRGKVIFHENEKSKLSASDGLAFGEYKFFTSSGTQSKWLDSFIMETESLMFSTGGSAGVQYCNEKYSYSTDTWSLYTSDKYCLKFYYYYFSSIVYQINNLGFQGAGLGHLQKDFIKQNLLPVPDLSEQIEIVHYLDDEVNKIETAVKFIDNSILALKQLRKTLVTDVVTGKLKIK
jgi:type I restriction enzyme S subunit